MFLKFITLPRGSLLAAAAVITAAWCDNADAQIHHRYRHYPRGQYQQPYCPPADDYTLPSTVPTAPRFDAQGRPLSPNVTQTPDQATQSVTGYLNHFSDYIPGTLRAEEPSAPQPISSGVGF